MLLIPTVAFQPPGQDQLEMDGNCFSVENHISLAQASQKPAFTSIHNLKHTH
jgi:hypothetical protein